MISLFKPHCLNAYGQAKLKLSITGVMNLSEVATNIFANMGFSEACNFLQSFNNFPMSQLIGLLIIFSEKLYRQPNNFEDFNDSWNFNLSFIAIQYCT